jgi:uncharacterized OsmC-like protein
MQASPAFHEEVRTMKPEVIQQTIAAWQSAPEKAKSRPTVVATADGAQAAITAGPFAWRADLPPGLGGGNGAPSPTALLLSALAGCAVVFIRDTLAPQLGVAVDGVKATASCDADARGLVGMPGAVPDLQNFAVAIELQSSAPRAKLDELIEVWKARCPIYLAIQKPTAVAMSVSVAG